MSIFVRRAEREDILPIIHLLEKFAGESGVKNGSEHFSQQAVGGMVGYSLMNGCCFVAVNKVEGAEETVGVILGSIGVNPWTASVREMREIAWYVLPEYRKTKAGIQLYKRYVEYSKELIEGGDICASFVATLVGSGEEVENLVLQDFERSEVHYVMGG